MLLDLRYACRIYRKHPALTAAGLATIAMAVAINTAIFSLVDSVLLAPLALPDADRVVRIEERHPAGRQNLTGATFADLRSRSRSLRAVASFRLTTPGVNPGSRPEQVTAAEVSDGYFDVLGVAPALGRPFEPADFGARSASVVLSDGLWRRLFAADPGVVGRRILVNAEPTEVVGVMPRGLYAPGTPDIWRPLSIAAAFAANRRAHLFTVIGRLADGMSYEAARQELDAVAAGIVRDSGGAVTDLAFALANWQQRLVESVRPAMLVLWASVGLVLVIAAANIANLLLMQGAARGRELSIRTAVGASRARLLRQLAAESLLLGAAGGAMGTVLAVWSIPALAAALPASVPRSAALAADARVIGFGVLVSVLTAILFGIAPSIRLSARSPIDALRDRSADAAAPTWLRGALVVAEVALTVMLLAGVGLLGRSLVALVRVDPGFDPRNVMVFSLSLPRAAYPDAAAHARFYASVLDRLKAVPGISAAGATGALPLTGTPATTMTAEGSTARDSLVADVVTATPEFFAALRIPLKRGRLFTAADAAHAMPVVVVNETAVKRFWPDGSDPVGRAVTMLDWGRPYRAVVVGTVGDTRQRGLEVDPAPAVYYPLAQFPETTLSASIVVRTTGPAEGIVGATRVQIWSVDRDQPLGAVRPMESIAALGLAQRRFNVALLAAFAATALLLAAVGIYGIVAFSVGQRAREIGVRVALGARPADVTRLVLAQGIVPAGLGLTVGLAGALAASRLLQGLLYGVAPTDGVTLAGVTLVVAAIATAACFGPVRRAHRLDPALALRSE
jgi:putative ABC transport system permease protein